MLTKAEFQRLRSLREKKNREALGLFVVEGEKVVGELLATDFPFVEIYATDEWLARNGPVVSSAGGSGRTRLTPRADTPGRETPPPSVIAITAEEMSRASHFPTPSPVLAVGKLTRAPLIPDDLTHGLTIALDGVQDAGNVGAILRIADWFAFDRVVLSPDSADLFHQKVINASMGSFARVRTHTAELAPLFADARAVAADLPILGCDLDGTDVHTLPKLRDAIVVIGSEGRGLSTAVSAQLTQRITIPRRGHAESLNAAIAAAIVCDNLRR